jgi:hypothetical protein
MCEHGQTFGRLSARPSARYNRFQVPQRLTDPQATFWMKLSKRPPFMDASYRLCAWCAALTDVDPKPERGSALNLSGSCILVIMQVLLDPSRTIGPHSPHWRTRTRTTNSMDEDRSIHKQMICPSMMFLRRTSCNSSNGTKTRKRHFRCSIQGFPVQDET